MDRLASICANSVGPTKSMAANPSPASAAWTMTWISFQTSAEVFWAFSTTSSHDRPSDDSSLRLPATSSRAVPKRSANLIPRPWAISRENSSASSAADMSTDSENQLTGSTLTSRARATSCRFQARRSARPLPRLRSQVFFEVVPTRLADWRQEGPGNPPPAYGFCRSERRSEIPASLRAPLPSCKGSHHSLASRETSSFLALTGRPRDRLGGENGSVLLQ